MEAQSLRNYVNADNNDAVIVPDFNRTCKLLSSFASVPHSSLLALALLFRICRIMEKDNETSNRLYNAICKCLQNLNYLDRSTNLLSDLIIKQPQFVDAITEFMQKVHNQILNPNVLTPPASNCLDKKLSLTSVYTYQTNRYSESFDEVEVIAEGGFGTVCKAIHKVDRAVYAVKKIFFKYKNDAQFEKIIREAKQLAALKHPHIVNYNNAWLDTADDFGGGDETDSSSSSSGQNTPDPDIACQKPNFFFKSNSERLFSAPIDISSTDSDEAFEPVKFSVEPNISKTIQHSFGATCLDNASADDNEAFEAIEITVEPSTPEAIHQNYSSAATSSSSDFSKKESLLVEQSSFDNGSCQNILSHDIKKLAIRATLYIQMEYCDHDLRSWLRLRSNKTESNMNQLKPMDIFYQVLSGVEYIHSKSVIHRDLTPNNIFITKEQETVKIGDFGLACLVHQTEEKMKCSTGRLSSVLGTPPYAAPEQKGNHQYDFKVDIYSLGIVLLELLCPCATSMEFSLLVEDVLKGTYPSDLIQKFPDHVRLITQMIKINPSERPTASEILGSPLFKHKSAKKRIEDLKDRLIKLSNSNLELETLVISLKTVQTEVLEKCLEENVKLQTQNELQNERIKELEQQVKELLSNRLNNGLNG